MLTPPLGSISDIFEFKNILMAEDPQTNILKGLFKHIYIEKGQIKCFNFSFFRMIHLTTDGVSCCKG